jgi:hypothetical protein
MQGKCLKMKTWKWLFGYLLILIYDLGLTYILGFVVFKLSLFDTLIGAVILVTATTIGYIISIRIIQQKIK